MLTPKLMTGFVVDGSATALLTVKACQVWPPSVVDAPETYETGLGVTVGGAMTPL